MPAVEAGAQRGTRGHIDRLVGVLGELTAWISLAIVVLMATNVVLRYLFSYGSVWAQELEWHLLVPLVLFGMSYALQHGEHVRVDILYGKFPERAKTLVDLFSALLTVAIAAIVVVLSVKYVQQAYVIDEGSPDPGGIPHRYIIKSLIPIGFAVLFLQAVAVAITCSIKLRELR